MHEQQVSELGLVSKIGLGARDVGGWVIGEMRTE